MNNSDNSKWMATLERRLRIHQEWINLNTKYVLILALFNLIYTSILVCLVVIGLYEKFVR